MYRRFFLFAALFSITILGWAQAPCPCWIEPDASYTTIDNDTAWISNTSSDPINNDDGSYGPIDLPFTFAFYGEARSSIYININGNISFEEPYSTFTAEGFPVEGFSIVAPFWSDVDLGGMECPDCNKVHYRLTPTALYVNWSRVGYFNEHTDKVNSFQLILTNGTDPVVPNGANVSFCYGDMHWTGGDIYGENGFGGAGANVGANHGNDIDHVQFGRFDHASSDWDGPFGAADGVGWLTDRHFVFNTATPAIPPIVTNIGCDTLDVEVGFPLEHEMIMIPGDAGLETSATSSCGTFINYSESANISGEVARIVSNVTPTEDELGLHQITYMATDNSVPPLTSLYTVYVRVLPATTVGLGENDAGQDLLLSPNPACDRVHLQFGPHTPSLIEAIASDGRIALSFTPTSNSSNMWLDISDLRPGIYLLRATGPEGIRTTRLVRSAAE